MSNPEVFPGKSSLTVIAQRLRHIGEGERLLVNGFEVEIKASEIEIVNVGEPWLVADAFGIR